MQIPKLLDAEQIDLLEPVSRKLAHSLNDEEVKQAIYIQKVAPQLLDIMNSVIDKTETLLIKGSVGRTNYLDSMLHEIKQKSQVVEALLKSA